MIPVIEALIEILAYFLKSHSSSLPGEVVNAVKAAGDALTAHKNDLITKQGFEAQRGD